MVRWYYVVLVILLLLNIVSVLKWHYFQKQYRICQLGGTGTVCLHVKSEEDESETIKASGLAIENVSAAIYVTDFRLVGPQLLEIRFSHAIEQIMATPSAFGHVQVDGDPMPDEQDRRIHRVKTIAPVRCAFLRDMVVVTVNGQKVELSARNGAIDREHIVFSSLPLHNQ